MKVLPTLIGLLLLLQQPRSLTVNVGLQQVVATVRDESGKVVKNLKKEDFIVEDGGISQEIVHFSDDPDAPISLGILIDITGSMGTMPGGAESGLTAASGITRVLLHRLKPDDEIVLMTFRKNVFVQQSFTKDHTRIENALSLLRLDRSPLMISRYSTPPTVLTALPPALEQVHKSSHSKRALIVMTDAYFSGNVNEVASVVRRAEIPIFTFAMRGVDFGPKVRYCQMACHEFETLPPPQIGNATPLPNLTQPLLDVLANESGGRSTVFELDPRNTMQRVNAAIDEIAAELRGQYVLGYYPRSWTPNRTIRIRALNPTYRVHMRREDQPVTRP